MDGLTQYGGGRISCVATFAKFDAVRDLRTGRTKPVVVLSDVRDLHGNRLMEKVMFSTFIFQDLDLKPGALVRFDAGVREYLTTRLQKISDIHRGRLRYAHKLVEPSRAGIATREGRISSYKNPQQIASYASLKKSPCSVCKAIETGCHIYGRFLCLDCNLTLHNVILVELDERRQHEVEDYFAANGCAPSRAWMLAARVRWEERRVAAIRSFFNNPNLRVRRLLYYHISLN